MASSTRIQFTARINAPVPTVWHLMIGPELQGLDTQMSEAEHL